MTIKTLIEAKKAGQFRAFWKDFNESVNLMASGEVVIQSMWSPAVTAVRTKGIACIFQPLKEGYRAWAVGLRPVQATLTGKQARRRLRVHQLVPRRLGRRLPQPPGLLLGRARHRQGQDGALRVGLLDGRQARRRRTSRAPTATLLEKAGAVRDGGSYDEPHGRRRLLERGDGRERLHGPEVERVHRRLMRLERRCAHCRAAARRAGGRSHAARATPASLGARRLAARCRPGCRPRRWRWCSCCSSCVPLALIVHGQLLGLQRLRDAAGLHAATTTSTIFEGCSTAADLCVTFKTYLSTLQVLLAGLADHAGDRLHGRLFPGLPRALSERADGAVRALHHPVLDLATSSA